MDKKVFIKSIFCAAFTILIAGAFFKAQVFAVSPSVYMVKEGPLLDGNYYREYNISSGWKYTPDTGYFDMNFTNIDEFYMYNYYNRLENCCSNPTSYNKPYQKLSVIGKKDYYFDDLDIGAVNFHTSEHFYVGDKHWGVEHVSYSVYVPDDNCLACGNPTKRWANVGYLYLVDKRGRAKMQQQYDVKAGDSVTISPEYNEYAASVKWGIKYNENDAFTLLSDGVLPNGTVVSGSQTKQLVLSNLPDGISPMYFGAYIYDKDGQLPENVTYPDTKFVSKVAVYTPVNEPEETPTPGDGNGGNNGGNNDGGNGGNNGGNTEGGENGGNGGYGNGGKPEGGDSGGSGNGGNTPNINAGALPSGGGNTTIGTGTPIPGGNPGGNSEGNPNINENSGNSGDGGNSGGGSNSGGGAGGENPASPASSSSAKTLDDYKGSAKKDDYITGNVIKSSPQSSSSKKLLSGSENDGSGSSKNADKNTDKNTDGGSKTGNPKLISDADKNKLFDKIRSNSREYVTNSETSKRNLKENASESDAEKIKVSSLDYSSDEAYVDKSYTDDETFSPDVKKKSPVFYAVTITLVILFMLILLFVLFFGVIIVAPKENELLKLSDDLTIKVPVGIRMITIFNREWAVNFGEILSKHEVVDVYLGILFAYVFEGEDIKILTCFKGEKKKEIATEKIKKQLTIGSKRGIK